MIAGGQERESRQADRSTRVWYRYSLSLHASSARSCNTAKVKLADGNQAGTCRNKEPARPRNKNAWSVVARLRARQLAKILLSRDALT